MSNFSYKPMDCNLPGSSVHGISQARILEWVVTIFFSRVSSWLRDWTRISCIAGRLLMSHKGSFTSLYIMNIFVLFLCRTLTNRRVKAPCALRRVLKGLTWLPLGESLKMQNWVGTAPPLPELTGWRGHTQRQFPLLEECTASVQLPQFSLTAAKIWNDRSML